MLYIYCHIEKEKVGIHREIEHIFKLQTLRKGFKYLISFYYYSYTSVLMDVTLCHKLCVYIFFCTKTIPSLHDTICHTFFCSKTARNKC